ncbi:MAG: hypothetical protein HN352_17495 [Bacteroidetes bacterium]|jgi:hypothetical protein|nr:hypothetical protein [Bacteroidota bacterium]MBT3750157.1 hypothetical protein [Bacteroidota bacterium]MBT4399838.1 hypothetical protein [Bacteroidota bacterium]MBT4410900.1 hypothetical protein [Bacteroidota bacterium]MBT5424903.1 hypothetical protein [Bacteroidota bacterium]
MNQLNFVKFSVIFGNGLIIVNVQDCSIQKHIGEAYPASELFCQKSNHSGLSLMESVKMSTDFLNKANY